MNITITKAENGWVMDTGPGTKSYVATDATLGQIVCQVAGISPMADVPQTVEAPEPIFQPGDIVECINNAHVTEALLLDVHYTVNNYGPDGLLKLEGVDGNWMPERFRKVEPVAQVDGEEVPGEAEAWTEWAPDIVWNPKDAWLRDSQQRFRAALRVAIEADRKKRGVGGVITKSNLAQFCETYERTVGYNSGMRAALATLGITVED